jgi:hypothetical protein
MIEHGYMEVRIVSRSRGHSVVRRAALNARAKLYDQRLNRTWNHLARTEVRAQFVLAPSTAPLWVLDREALWNSIEHCDTRPDAQLARELEISLPQPLSLGAQVGLVSLFLDQHFVARGMVADCTIRTPNPPARRRAAIHPVAGPWAYVLLTMREFAGESFGEKRRDWNDWSLQQNTRLAWELAANRALEASGSEVRIDMRPRAAAVQVGG